ncbi:putative oxidoreductase [Xylaria arbuscula]|nr:putative oxidoreductase [Xylaria arbuscula]
MTCSTRSLSTCCAALVAVLSDRTFLPGTQGYDESLSSYYSQQEQLLRPGCFVKPSTAAETSLAMYTMSVAINEALLTGEDPCSFAIRSGGHGGPASSNIADEVTIDLRGLGTIDVEGDVVSVQAGCTWDQVYARLDPLRLSVAGGRNAGVGVGGLTTGGGISFFSPRYGWACDTLLNVEVVLANGSIVNANSDENEDLLRAIRGGSNNFGIVTRFDFQAFEQDGLWGGLSYYSLSTIDEHLDTLVEFSNPDTYDEYSSLITSFVLKTGVPPLLATNLEYTKPVEYPPSLKRITAIPSLSSTLRLANMTELSVELASTQSYGLRQLSVEITLATNVAILKTVFLRWQDTLSAIQLAASVDTWAISLEPLPPAIYQRRSESNSLGLEDRSQSLMILLLSAAWADTEDDTLVEQTARSMFLDIEIEAKRLGVYDPFVYLNYAAPWQDPFASYGVASRKRLQEVRQRYDPRQIFSFNVPGGFDI